MTFSLEFDQRALKEWHKLGDTVRQQYKNKLTKVLAKTLVEATTDLLPGREIQAG